MSSDIRKWQKILTEDCSDELPMPANSICLKKMYYYDLYRLLQRLVADDNMDEEDNSRAAFMTFRSEQERERIEGFLKKFGVEYAKIGIDVLTQEDNVVSPFSYRRPGSTCDEQSSKANSQANGSTVYSDDGPQ